MDEKIDFAAEAPHNAGLFASGGFANIATRLFNTPLLIAPDKLQAILFALSSRMGFVAERPTAEGVMQPMAGVGRWETRDRERGSGMLIDNGVGILPVTGSLVNRGAWIGSSSGLQSYDGIAQQLRMAADDKRIHSVLLDLNSYGGEAAGVAALAEEIRELDATKPVVALVADAAASAAYWLASAAREVVVTETGLAGSIGVVLTHQDVTAAAEKAGIKITQIHAGKEKLLGTPFRPLSDSDVEKLQLQVDELYELFNARVASYRGRDAKDMQKTEARVYRGQQAVDAGLADRVMSGRALLAEMQARTNPTRGKSRPTGVTTMSNTKETAGGEGSGQAAKTYTETELTAAKASEFERGTKAGATAERERCAAIIGHEHAAGRTKLAHQIAFKSDSTVAQAGDLLAAAPKEQGGRLDAAMQAAGGTAGVGQDSGEGAAKSGPAINAADIHAQRNKRK
jgi:capsid assembly protease